ncbi:transcriptional regulator [Lactobacillus helveticus MTCC 5463]|nr:transcriptional regulator [Lactobacillus helveticus MTCC 5463]
MEQLGLAFYSETGRSGGYHITNSKLLLPIRFNTAEINAIFFALQAIKNISETPYSNAYQKIQVKLLKNLPTRLQKQINLQEEFVQYVSQPSLNKVTFFDLLLKACINNDLVLAENQQFIKEKQKLQLLDLFYQAGNWFCHAYNLDLKRWFVLRLDKFKVVKQLKPDRVIMSKNELSESYQEYEQKHYCIPYQCLLTKAGEQKVKYNSYPIMEVIHNRQGIYLNGSYNKEELHYLVDYLISLGSEVKIIKSRELKEKYLEKLQRIIQQY